MIKKAREIIKFSKIFFILFLSLSFTCFSATPEQDLQAADSLFSNLKYTESFEIYESLFTHDKVYSSSMLLKMAFIKEGLGDYSSALYYLNTYFNETLDRNTLLKIEELAASHQLVGYESSMETYFLHVFFKYLWVTAAVIAFLLFISLFFSIKRVNKGKSFVPLIVVLSFLAAFGITFNWKFDLDKAIVMNDTTYLMDGPSGAANVVETISKGHKLIVQKHDEIWSTVIWDEKEYYVRQSKLKEII